MGECLRLRTSDYIGSGKFEKSGLSNNFDQIPDLSAFSLNFLTSSAHRPKAHTDGKSPS